MWTTSTLARVRGRKVHYVPKALAKLSSFSRGRSRSFEVARGKAKKQSENGCHSHVISRVESVPPIRWRRRYQYSPQAIWIRPR